MIDITTGKAPPSHEPIHNTPRRVNPHGLGCPSQDPLVGSRQCPHLQTVMIFRDLAGFWRAVSSPTSGSGVPAAHGSKAGSTQSREAGGTRAGGAYSAGPRTGSPQGTVVIVSCNGMASGGDGPHLSVGALTPMTGTRPKTPKHPNIRTIFLLQPMPQRCLRGRELTGLLSLSNECSDSNVVPTLSLGAAAVDASSTAAVGAALVATCGGEQQGNRGNLNATDGRASRHGWQGQTCLWWRCW